jgi:ShK domain-like
VYLNQQVAMHSSLTACLLSVFLLFWTTPVLEDKTCAAAASGDGKNDDIADACRSTADEAIPCRDDYAECSEWAVEGSCATNSSFMLSSCRKSCQLCDHVNTMEGGEIHISNCFGKAQVAAGWSKEITIQRVQNVSKYMFEHVFKEPLYKNIRSSCKNLHEYCSYWAAAKQRCEKDVLFMSVVCSLACYSCHRCAFDNETFTPDAWPRPGDVDGMFLRLISAPELQQYNPMVHFKPQNVVITASTAGDTDTVMPRDGPWVVTLDNFLDKEECETLIQLGNTKGFKPSMRASSQETDRQAGQVSNHRTSTNAFCDYDCLAHPVVQRALKKMEEITGIPARNAEHLQLVRYEVGQAYGIHHDFSPLAKNRVEGVRILIVPFLSISTMCKLVVGHYFPT